MQHSILSGHSELSKEWAVIISHEICPLVLQDQLGGLHQSSFQNPLVWLNKILCVGIKRHAKRINSACLNGCSRKRFKCALVRKVDQKGQREEPLISACADKILLSSQGDACLLFDRRLIPCYTRSCQGHECICVGDCRCSFSTHAHMS